MNEELDSKRDRKSAMRRRVIHKALSQPADSTIRSHAPLAQQISFAKSVILPKPTDPKTEQKKKEQRKVVNELVDELINPSFEDVIKIFASTFNPDEETRDLNERNQYKRGVSIQKQNGCWNRIVLHVLSNIKKSMNLAFRPT